MIILDLDMPIMNGYQACMMIRSLTSDHEIGIKGLLKIQDEDNVKQSSRGLVIVAYSGFVNSQIITKCEECGFNDVSKRKP